METRSATKVKLAAEGRPRRMVKVTEKALKPKVVKTNKVKAKPKKPKIAEEPKKTMKRKAVEKAPGKEANGSMPSKRTKVKAINDLVRRSSQRKNVNLSEKIQEKKDVPLDEINLTDSAGEVELLVEPIVSVPTRVVKGKKPFASEATQIVNYKTLYVDLQKKIEDSTEENYKRTIELSYLRGKVDAYEYIIGNMKNIVDFSNMKLIDGETNLYNGTTPDLNADNEPAASPVNGKSYVRRSKKNSS